MFLMKVTSSAANRTLSPTAKDCRDGIRRLLELAEIVPEQQGAKQTTDAPSFLARVGTASTDVFVSLSEMLRFLGDVTLTFVKLVKMRARYRTADLLLIVQECGPQALPIVTLISFLAWVLSWRLSARFSSASSAPRSMWQTSSPSPSFAIWAP